MIVSVLRARRSAPSAGARSLRPESGRAATIWPQRPTAAAGSSFLVGVTSCSLATAAVGPTSPLFLSGFYLAARTRTRREALFRQRRQVLIPLRGVNSGQGRRCQEVAHWEVGAKARTWMQRAQDEDRDERRREIKKRRRETWQDECKFLLAASLSGSIQ